MTAPNPPAQAKALKKSRSTCFECPNYKKSGFFMGGFCILLNRNLNMYEERCGTRICKNESEEHEENE